jgi:hypothetical protein
VDTFNFLIFLWQASLCLSVLLFVAGIWKKSAIFMLLSFFAFLPVSYFFIGAENSFKVLAIVPLFLLVLTFSFWGTNENK